MQKIERHTSVQRRRKSIIPLILSILVFLLALAPLSDLFRFGERELSFFVAIDIVTIIGFLVVYNIMKRHVSILFSSVQLGALALFGVATAHFLQNTPSYDTFFGIVRGTSAYLPLALFSLTILLVPFLTVTKNAIRAFFAIVFALPLLVLANQFLVDSIVPTAYVGVFVLFIGMFALPLYTMTLRNFVVTCIVALTSFVQLWFAHGAIPPSVVFVLLGGSIVYAVRMILSLHYACRTSHIATQLTHNPTIRVQGVFAIITILFLLIQNGQSYVRGIMSDVGRLFTQEKHTLSVLFTDATNYQAPNGTLTEWVQNTGIFGVLTLLALIGAAVYVAYRAIREPEYYEKSWYTLVYVSAAAVGIGTLIALLMPIGVGGMLLLATAYALLCVSAAKISPSHAWVIITTKWLVTRRALAIILSLCVALTWYYAVRYATATHAASKSAWYEAYQRMPSPHYLAVAIAGDVERFRNEITAGIASEKLLDAARTVTTSIVDARKRYPENSEIEYVALMHYELLTQLGVKGAADEAIAILEKLHTQHPDVLLLTLRYASALLEASRAKDALDILDKNKSFVESDTELHYNTLYAYVLMALENYDAAAKMFANIISNGANDRVIYLAYGISQVHSDIPAARRILAEAIAKFPSDASVYIYAALIEQIAGDRATAQATLERGIRRATVGDITILRTLLDELMQKGSITSVGIANIPLPEPLPLDISTSTATTTSTILNND